MRVGVILAVRGPAPYLAEALRSVVGADQIVVVDHASEPPLEVPEAIRIDDASGGPARARQAALDALSTDLVALIDADDVWEDGKLEAQLRSLGGAAVSFGRATVIGAEGRPTRERLPELRAGRHEAAAMREALYERNWIPASSALIRRDALLTVGGFAPGTDLPAGSDWDLWLRLAAADYDFVCEPAARIRYRRHEGGLTSSVSRLAQAGLAIHERHRGLVDEVTYNEAKAADLVALARGRIRERRWGDARRALADVKRLRRLSGRERVIRTLSAIPGVRGALGRRNPYRET
jgi:glycosyltransferase involved in cell wall biosynthesis